MSAKYARITRVLGIVAAAAGVVALIGGAVKALGWPSSTAGWLAPLCVGGASVCLGLLLLRAGRSHAAPMSGERHGGEEPAATAVSSRNAPRRITGAAVSLFALLLTAILGYWSIRLSFRFSSESAESIDQLGRAVLVLLPQVKAPPSSPKGKEAYLLAEEAQTLMDSFAARRDTLLAKAESVPETLEVRRKLLDSATALRDTALRLLCLGESLLSQSHDAPARVKLGLTLANLDITLGDSLSALQERAIVQYDDALRHRRALQLVQILQAKWQRWWALLRLGKLSKPPAEVSTIGTAIFLALASAVTLVLWAHWPDITAVRRQRRASRRAKSSGSPGDSGKDS